MISKLGSKKTQNQHFLAIFIFPLLKGCYFFMIFLSSNKMVIYLCLFVGLKWGFRKFQLLCSVERLAKGISHSFCQFQMRVFFSEKVQMQQLAKKVADIYERVRHYFIIFYLDFCYFQIFGPNKFFLENRAWTRS